MVCSYCGRLGNGWDGGADNRTSKIRQTLCAFAAECSRREHLIGRARFWRSIYESRQEPGNNQENENNTRDHQSPAMPADEGTGELINSLVGPGQPIGPPAFIPHVVSVVKTHFRSRVARLQ